MFDRKLIDYLPQELPDSLCQILDAALVSLKNPELINAAEESRVRKDSENAAASNAEVVFSKSVEAARQLDSDRTLHASSGMSTSRASDDASDISSQTS
jgi:hypothetical protein